MSTERGANHVDFTTTEILVVKGWDENELDRIFSVHHVTRHVAVPFPRRSKFRLKVDHSHLRIALILYGLGIAAAILLALVKGVPMDVSITVAIALATVALLILEGATTKRSFAVAVGFYVAGLLLLAELVIALRAATQ